MNYEWSLKFGICKLLIKAILSISQRKLEDSHAAGLIFLEKPKLLAYKLTSGAFGSSFPLCEERVDICINWNEITRRWGWVEAQQSTGTLSGRHSFRLWRSCWP